LDVPPTRARAAQIAHGEIAALELDPEEIIAAGLAVVGHPDAEVAAVSGVRRIGPADVAGAVVDEHVAGDARRFHVQARAVVEVVQVTPERAVLHAPADAEVPLGAGGSSDDPPSAGHEIGRSLLAAPPGEDPTGASAQAMTNAAEMKLPATARPASASEASEST